MKKPAAAKRRKRIRESTSQKYLDHASEERILQMPIQMRATRIQPHEKKFIIIYRFFIKASALGITYEASKSNESIRVQLIHTLTLAFMNSDAGKFSNIQRRCVPGF